MNKYLICRPEGGVNDIFCQIHKCLEYSKKNNRILVIDTESSDSFADEFGYYFKMHYDKVITKNTRNYANLIIKSGLETFPKLSAEALILSKPVYDPQANYSISGVPLTFDFSISYPEPILIHHQCGGGDDSKGLLPLLSISKPLCILLEHRVMALPFCFTGYHCRNTDMQSDIALAYEDIKNIHGPVFLASDSFEFIQKAKKYLTAKLFTFSQIPDFSGRPIHHEAVSPDAKRLINTDSILDLFILGLAQRVICSNLNSGYGNLAKNLSNTLSLRNFEKTGFRLFLHIFFKVISNRFKR